MTILDRRLLIVGGKGGTGKSVVAAALAELSAFRGQRTLLVSADGSPGAAGMFGIVPGHDAVEVAANLSVLQIESKASLAEFVKLQLGPLGAVSGPVASAFSFVAEAAPGVAELLLVGKYAEEARSGNWDLVVVDAASSGHLLGELAAPTGVGEIAPIGRLARETGWVVELLGDAEVTGVINVTLAEEVPVVETLEFVERLHDETPASLAAVVVNRTRPQLYARSRRESLDSVLADRPARMTKGAHDVFDAVQIGLDRADVALAIDERLRAELPENMLVLHVPEFGIVSDIRAAIRVAIADELSL
jgi:anion-transporting  ArsA/GET3 family ATPase